MKYNFNTPINRRGTDSLKWDVAEQELPMWVADMDFQTAPEILEAIHKRTEHGVFGYGNVTEEWYQAYMNWWQRRHDFTMRKDWLIFCTGVVPAISSIVRKLTTPNENVLIQTPVYNIFFNSIINNGCRVLESPLVYRDGIYEIDFTELEEKLSDPQTTLMILCNPHNPIGKIWDKETLARIGTLCNKYHVTVISDEIHCDLTAPGKEYTPFASASEDCRAVSITCIAPTKAFNLAGMQTAAVCVPDAVLRHKVWRALNTDEVAEPNSFAVPVAVAAFERGEDWLNALREYLWENRKIVTGFIEKEIPLLRVVSGEATYLVWLDTKALADIQRQQSLDCLTQEPASYSEELATFIRRKTGLYLAAGAAYGRAGAYFLRMNIACPQSTLIDGLQRLKEGVQAYMAAKTQNGRIR
ncbi:MAG: pyridoxal phosphate-dependent aminotransferase [Lachnospiraceae bacterium]|nr:pyridoxal phosphate-dependent aminotransferase [Lachnospiraceae bacterium]